MYLTSPRIEYITGSVQIYTRIEITVIDGTVPAGQFFLAKGR